jgi:hypothetical protein
MVEIMKKFIFLVIIALIITGLVYYIFMGKNDSANFLNGFDGFHINQGLFQKLHR